MSGRLVGRCLRESSTTSSSALLVLLVIAEHSRDDGLGAILNLSTIARESRLSIRQTIRWVKHLTALGDLAVVAHKGRTSAYIVTPGVMTSTSLPAHDASVTPPVTSATPTSDIHDTKPVTSVSTPIEPYEPYEPSSRAPARARARGAPTRSGNGFTPVGDVVLQALLANGLDPDLPKKWSGSRKGRAA